MALAIRDVSKAFRLPHEQVHTLKERVLHPFRTRSEETLDALNAVSTDIRSGEFFGIVGRNGSGKTTLMKCLAGIYRRRYRRDLGRAGEWRRSSSWGSASTPT